MSYWIGNHNTSLSKSFCSAWMIHGRDQGVSGKWMATISLYAPEFGAHMTKTIYGVQDDFGNFVEVPHAFI